MGRLILFILVIVAVVLLWKAFGPSSWNRQNTPEANQQRPAIKGPDDDEEFLWNIEKQRFKERREKELREEAEREEELRRRRFEERNQPPRENPEDK